MAFTCKYGTFRFEVMPFGLMNAPAIFQRMMIELLKDITFARVYIEDVVIFSASLEDHIEHIWILLRRIEKDNIQIKLKKCFFAKDSIHLLGHIVSTDGIA